MTRLPATMSWTRRLLAMFPLFACVQVHAEAPGPAPLFMNQEILEATVEGPIDVLMDERSEETEHDGYFRFVDDAGNAVNLDVKLRIRGKFRARPDICEFAPLRLNFRKSQVKGTLFEGQDKLKLVTHCDNGDREYEQYVLKEYLAYRFLSTISDSSFLTRLLKVTYIDTEGKERTRTKYAFLIEHKDALAERLGLPLANVPSIEFDQLDQQQTNLVTVFSYFIGNTDLTAFRGPAREHCCHNVELFMKPSGLLWPVPYDFDISGVVNAPYAGPREDLPIQKVTTRLYRGLCRNNELLPLTFERFRNKRNEILQLVADQEGLSRNSRAKLSRFVEKFYKTIDSDRQIRREFTEECSAASAPPAPT